MRIQDAMRLVREACVMRHLSLNTERTYIHWLGRYRPFLKDPKRAHLPAERKMEAFLTYLAISGVSASTQNQAFNALLFFHRQVLKQELGPVQSLRAKQPVAIRQAPSSQEVRQLLATVSDLYGYPTRLIVHLFYGCGLRVAGRSGGLWRELATGVERRSGWRADGLDRWPVWPEDPRWRREWGRGAWPSRGSGPA